MKSSMRRRHQLGFSMIEAMVSVVILSFGLLAIAGFQVRVMASTASANFGEQAARLANDMAERIRANPYAAGKPGGSFYAQRGGWGAPGSKPSPDCDQTACSTWEMGLYDIWAWKTAVVQALPEGEAAILEEAGQLRAVVSWRDHAQFIAPVAAGSGCPASTSRSCLRMVIGIPNP
jgi:type IV pilus assembly protein PilV